jgi:trigger factor
VKASKETLSPTRVKITVEVPFDELKPSVDAAYRKLGKQVRVSGFRPGKVPPRILDQRLGRGVVLDEALQEALPRLYSEAVEQEKVDVLSRPEVDVTAFSDGDPLVFTAEVDVRPEVDVPDYAGLEVTVDPAGIGDSRVDEQLDMMRDRFAVLTPADRPVASGDYVSIDLSATVDGEVVDDATATGMSYEVGSDNLVKGLDEALEGASDGDSRTFTTELVAGEYAGRSAEVTVTVRGVKEKERPDLDDDFATTASEFDTLAELRDDVRTRLERVGRLQQGAQARDNALDTLLERVDVPLPESVVDSEVHARMHSLEHQLESMQMSKDDYLKAEEKSEEEFDREVRESAEKAVKAQFVLDAVAAKEELSVSEQELTEQILRSAQRAGVSPDRYAQQVVQSGQLGAVMADVLRGKALQAVVRQATITDTEGASVDLSVLDADQAALSGVDLDEDDLDGVDLDGVDLDEDDLDEDVDDLDDAEDGDEDGDGTAVTAEAAAGSVEASGAAGGDEEPAASNAGGDATR